MKWGRKKSDHSSSSVFSRVFSGSWFSKLKPRNTATEVTGSLDSDGSGNKERGIGIGNQARFYSLEEADVDWMVPVVEKHVVQGRRSTGGINHRRNQNPLWCESDCRFRGLGFNLDSPRRDEFLKFSDMVLEKQGKIRARTSPSHGCPVKLQNQFQSPRREATKMKCGRQSFAMVKSSSDPEKDFRESIVEMIRERGIVGNVKEVEELLACYLMLNSDEYHDLIIAIFRQVWAEMNRNQAQLVHLLRIKNKTSIPHF